MKILFFDLETTGLDTRTCAIHQLAGLVEIDGVVRETFNYHIRPHEGAEMVDAALEMACVTTAQIAGYPTAESVHREFTDMLARYINRYNKSDKFYLAGYNSRSFDEPFLRQLFLRNNDNYYGAYFWQIGFDVMVLAAERLKHALPSMPNFKLPTVAVELGVSIPGNLHDAAHDIALTYAIYKALQTSIDGTQLAKLVLQVLDAQQKYFEAARKGSPARTEALERSKAMERELRTTCEALCKPKSQPTLF